MGTKIRQLFAYNYLYAAHNEMKTKIEILKARARITRASGLGRVQATQPPIAGIRYENISQALQNGLTPLLSGFCGELLCYEDFAALLLS